MKLFKKVKQDNGKRNIYLGNWKIFSYIKPIKCKNSSSIIAPTNNKINIPERGNYFIRVMGINNEIYIKKGLEGSIIHCTIYGNNNRVFINSHKFLNINITIGLPDYSTTNCLFSVGEDTLINGLNCLIVEKNSSVTIGTKCMLSDEIELWCSDTHSVLDEHKNLLNKGEKVQIENHVWIGKRVTILKNSIIPSGSIVGMCSVVSKKFTEKNCVIAGNPAKIVKSNICWDEIRPDKYQKPAK